MKRLAQAIALVSCAALLSGCIIVPHRHGGYRHGHYQGAHDAGGAVIVKPGPRR